MTFYKLAAAAALFALSACMTTTEGAAPTAATPLIGKSLTTEGGSSILLRADGTVGGKIRGDDVVGTYTASTTEICSTYSAPKMLAGKEFCSTPMIDGDTVIFNRRDGSKSPAYKISG